MDSQLQREATQSKLKSLRQVLGQLDSVLVALSGGIDSTLVAQVAHETLGPRAIALTALGPALGEAELSAAKRFSASLGMEHHVLSAAEIEDPNYRRNDSDRCYHCKTALYRLCAAKRVELGVTHVVNGTNLDDLSDHRPGLRAATEFGVKSPLLLASLRKEDVRLIARELGMAQWDKPAAPCLASRIPYGTPVSRERLNQVERLEAELRSLGLRVFRVRHHDSVARIEVPPEDFDSVIEHRKQILQASTRLGFRYLALDLEGFSSGSLNRALSHTTTDKRGLPVLDEVRN